MVKPLLKTTFCDLNQQKKIPEKIWGYKLGMFIPAFTGKVSSMIESLCIFGIQYIIGRYFFLSGFKPNLLDKERFS